MYLLPAFFHLSLANLRQVCVGSAQRRNRASTNNYRLTAWHLNYQGETTLCSRHMSR